MLEFMVPASVVAQLKSLVEFFREAPPWLAAVSVLVALGALGYVVSRPPGVEIAVHAGEPLQVAIQRIAQAEDIAVTFDQSCSRESLGSTLGRDVRFRAKDLPQLLQKLSAQFLGRAPEHNIAVTATGAGVLHVECRR